ncbi:methyltransferase [Undibacterium sp. CY18W]|uniref:Methyltransferase n=1 Tax=Undibacterium hunanense TaxID=2762292 RepID=A0ABR6ZMS5_9BURK|nr:DUF6250 domain-containing protein [Undibacterium hunanense]MBC3917193.1 methyltransferase [Undibacterium hunanense]
MFHLQTVSRPACKITAVVIAVVVAMVSALPAVAQSSEATCSLWGRAGKLIYQDDFDKDLRQWQVESADTKNSDISVANHQLLIDAAKGATVWFKQKLSGDILIRYTRRVVMEQGRNDRLSDLNQFWMATDPRNQNIFTRKGVFEQYDDLRLYYAGIGGNTNTTTRFRKYQGNGERSLLTELNERDTLLQANRDYVIETTVYQGCTRVLVDGKVFFSYRDKDALRDGYFGFRTTQSRQQVRDFKIYQLE